MEERMRAALSNVNWKRIRVALLKRTVPVPAPLFFLIFMLISWAFFTLYFKLERVTRTLDLLESRTSVMESQLQGEGDTPGDPLSDDEGEYAEPPPSALQM